MDGPPEAGHDGVERLTPFPRAKRGEGTHRTDGVFPAFRTLSLLDYNLSHVVTAPHAAHEGA